MTSNNYIYCLLIFFPDDFMTLFVNKVFSEAGTNDLRREQTTYIQFKDFLEEMEGITRTHSQLIIIFCPKKQFLCYLLSVLYLCHDILINNYNFFLM